MVSAVKEKIAKILQLSQQFKLFMDENDNVVRALNDSLSNSSRINC